MGNVIFFRFFNGLAMAHRKTPCFRSRENWFFDVFETCYSLWIVNLRFFEMRKKWKKSVFGSIFGSKTDSCNDWSTFCLAVNRLWRRFGVKSRFWEVVWVDLGSEITLLLEIPSF